MSDNIDIFKFEWYYIDASDAQAKGPISVRDIDVMMRTNRIDSNTYVWKEGLDDWKRLYQVNELTDIANTTHTEIQESLIRNKILSSFNINGQRAKNITTENYYFAADGLWHIYDPLTKSWSTQEKKPTVTLVELRNGFEEKNGEIKYSDDDSEEIFEDEEKEIENININMKKQETIIVDAIQDIEVNINSEIVLTDISVNQEEKFLNKKREKNIELQSEDKISASSKSDVVKKIEKRKRKKEKVKEKKKNQWYAPKVNSNIYVNCLPKDINEKEIIEYFSRCGFIRKDQRNDQYKVKLYKDSNGKNKGDALISFLREESVTMAVELLNETEIRPGFKIKVEKANFEQRGDYKPRETYKLDNIHRFKNKTDMNRMLGWNEEDNEKGLRIVVLKNMFEPKEFFEDEGLRKDLELDIIEECESNFGQVDKFLIYDENPDGIVKIKFNTPAAAEKCIKELHQRYYNEKLIEAFYWDGKTDFAKFQEDISSQEKRIDEFGRWLESTKDSEK